MRRSESYRIGRRVQEHLARVSTSSRVVGYLESISESLRVAWGDSTTGGSGRRGLDAVARAAETARVVTGLSTTLHRLQAPVQAATPTARMMALGRWSHRSTRSSALYRWLTTEPEPRVIVIDLRDTVSVGPAIGATGRAITWLTPRWSRAVVRRIVVTGVHVCRRRPLRVLGGLLASSILVGLAVEGSTGGLTPIHLVAAGSGTLLAAVLLRDERSIPDLAETRWGRWLIAAFKPPESRE